MKSETIRTADDVQRIAWADLSVRRIGHFDAFSDEQEGKLWPRMALWLHHQNGARAA